jgi:hypothetical protein
LYIHIDKVTEQGIRYIKASKEFACADAKSVIHTNIGVNSTFSEFVVGESESGPVTVKFPWLELIDFEKATVLE